MTALAGIRILDFTRILAGPFCTMLLGDLGADVLKIEQPHTGEDTRAWGPPWAGSGADRQSAYYLSVNRNKRSLTLDLKSSRGQQLARQLAARADVVIENFKVGQMSRYGLDYDALSTDNPRLVYCSITGYGQSGPQADQPGYDYVIQAQSGLMSITGPTDGTPYKVGVAISDVITGLFAANTIQAALLHRVQSNRGQYIDISLLDSQIAALVNVGSNYLISGEAPQRYGNAHANIVPYEAFEASDGYFTLNVGNDSQFKQCCAVIGLPDLANDERFRTNPVRVANRDALLAILRPILRQQPAAYWIEAFVAAGVPASSIADIPTMFASRHVQSRGLVQPVDLANGERVNLVGPTPKLSATPAAIQRPPPALGQHTAESLHDWLGLDAAEIDQLRAENIV
jgi:crotonobetainyl-CoA:carnitine CoA-transferase CaiB-like acyl-CoA transferase